MNLMIIHFSKHPFRQVAAILFILFYKSSWCKLASFRPPKPQRRPMPSLLYSSFFYICGLHLGRIVVIALFCYRGSVLVAALAGSLHLPADGLRQHLHQDPLHGLDVHATRPGFCVLFFVLFFTEYIVYNLYTLNKNLRKICWSPAQ